MRLLMFAAVLLSLATPALADEGGVEGVDQPITTESSAPSAQAQESEAQALDRAYCDNIELGHPDLERCEGILEGLVAEEELALEELMYMEAQAEEELLNQMVAESRLIAAERRDEAPEHSENSLATRATDPPTGFELVSAVLGVGVKWVAIGAVVGLVVGHVSGGNEYFGYEYGIAIGGSFGACIGIPIGAIKGWIAYSGEDTQVSIAPYRHDDASGLMFSGQF
jgi:hypothetical protein